MSDVVTLVGRHALQAANRDRLSVDSNAPAGRLAWPVARSSKDTWEDVRLPVDHVRVGVPTLRDQADVFRHIGVRRTSPLAVDNLMVVLGIADVRRTQTVILVGDTALSPSVWRFSRRKRADYAGDSTSGTRIARELNGRGSRGEFNISGTRIARMERIAPDRP